MFEVALCVMAYVVVLWIEFSPAFLERWGFAAIKRVLDRWMFVIVALGVLLPTMHQSSLGSMLLVMEYRLSPLWFTLWLPALFVISALAMGYAVVMFEATVVSKTFALPSEHALISKMSIVVGWRGEPAGFVPRRRRAARRRIALPPRCLSDRLSAAQQLVLLPFRTRADGVDRRRRARSASLPHLHQDLASAARRCRASLIGGYFDSHNDRPYHPHRGASAHRLRSRRRQGDQGLVVGSDVAGYRAHPQRSRPARRLDLHATDLRRLHDGARHHFGTRGGKRPQSRSSAQRPG